MIKILFLILVIGFLLLQIRLGVVADYDKNALTVRIRIGWVRVTVYPRKRKKKKRAARQQSKPKQPQEPRPSEPERASNRPWDMIRLIQDSLPLILEAVGSFRRKLVIDHLHLCLVAGSPDPADTALLYGRANAVLGAIWRPLVTAFHVKDGRVHVDVNFKKTELDLFIALSLKLWQILWLGLYFGVRVLIRLRQFRNERTNEKKGEL